MDANRRVPILKILTRRVVRHSTERGCPNLVARPIVFHATVQQAFQEANEMIDEKAIQAAIWAHAGWKKRLKDVIESGRVDVPIAKIRADDQCDFGRWLYGREISAEEKASEQYRLVKELHAQFHQQAASVAELAIHGKAAEATKAMDLFGDYSRASSKLTNALAEWRKKP